MWKEFTVRKGQTRADYRDCWDCALNRCIRKTLNMPKNKVKVDHNTVTFYSDENRYVIDLPEDAPELASKMYLGMIPKQEFKFKLNIPKQLL